MAFSSPGALFNTVSFLQENDTFDIDVIAPQTRAVSSASNFISLRKNLEVEGLRRFTPAELAEVEAEGLTYEPEDELINDPYLSAVLNKDREVQIDNMVYRYVDEGMIVYDASYAGQFEQLELEKINATGLEHGQQISLNKNVRFVKIVYVKDLIINDDASAGIDNPFDTSDEDDDTPEVIYNNDGSITLTTGVKIPKDKIKRTIFKHGNGDANGFQKWISGLTGGTNVVLENNFDSRHRMKLRMSNQDFIIYRTVGMTVRMQQKALGIWWRKKAQEFRYGWTAIEVEYKYKEFPFLDPPKMPDGTFQYAKTLRLCGNSHTQTMISYFSTLEILILNQEISMPFLPKD